MRDVNAVNTLILVNFFRLPTPKDQRKEPLNCKNPGNIELLIILKEFIKTRFN